MIRASLLGPIECTIDDAPPPAALRWRKHLALCVYLWHSDHRRASRDQLLALLWGDRAERDARHSLNEALRVIRRAAGREAVESDADWVTWRGPLALDTEAFTEAEHGDPGAVVHLIRGEWCEGFSVVDAPECDRWLDDERRLWRGRLVAALVRAAGLADSRGDLATALDLARRARRLEPLAESAARAELRARFLAGDRVAALEEGHRLVERLESELGLAPERETRDLLRGLAHDAVRRERTPAGGAAEPALTPLVGREAVMERLVVAFARGRDESRATILVVEGEPGSGRTRMLEECANRATVEGTTVLLVRAVPADRDHPGAGLRAIAAAGLRHAPGVAAIAAPALATLISEVPAWAERFASPDGIEPRASLADAVSAMLRATAAERPVLLAVDDAEWLDEFSLAVVPELQRALADVPFAVVLTCVAHAHGELDGVRRHLDRGERGTVIHLDPVGLGDLREAVTMALPSWSVEAQDRLARRLLAESGGLPAVAFQVLAAVLDGLDLPDQSWPDPDRTYDATLPSRLPAALVAAVRLRFRRLSEPAQQVAIMIALASGPVTESWLASVADQDEAAVAALLDELESERWLVSDVRGYLHRARTFASLIADEFVTPGMRRRLVARIGAVPLS